MIVEMVQQDKVTILSEVATDKYNADHSPHSGNIYVLVEVFEKICG